MNILAILENTLREVPGVRKSFLNFLKILVEVYLVLQGRLNFTHISRWCSKCERTIRRNFVKSFDFVAFNAQLLRKYVNHHDSFWAIDCSFISKSGTKTFGLDKFWNSALQRRTKGLEISLLSLVNATDGKAYNLNVEQTPSVNSSMEFYKSQLRALKNQMKEFSSYLVADGLYATKEFLDFVKEELGMELTVRLRSDADLKYLYEGPRENRRGPYKKYDGKVDFNDLSKWERQGTFKSFQVFTKVLFAPHFKRQLRVVVLKNKHGEYRVLASTDLNQTAKQIARNYSLRFQIEFNFRDAKQHLGLSHCQSRKKEALHFHFNIVMTVLNLTKVASQQLKTYSLLDLKAEQANQWWINFILSNLGINLSSIKKHPNYLKLCSWGRLRT